MTEVDELLAINNEAKSLTRHSPKIAPQFHEVVVSVSDQLKSKRKRDIKYESKEVFGSLGQHRSKRRLSLDFENETKAKYLDLKDILREKFDGYLANP